MSLYQTRDYYHNMIGYANSAEGSQIYKMNTQVELETLDFQDLETGNAV